jgi:hypothetical protein
MMSTGIAKPLSSTDFAEWRASQDQGKARMVKILVQGFCLSNGEFDRPRSVSG